jgi:phosphatidylinositol-3-phosphatase
MPSPWAAAFAVIALLAFGVGLGLYIRPQSSSPVLLASSPVGSTSTTSSTATTSGEPETPSGSSEESSTGSAETEESSNSSEEESKSKGSSGESGSEGEGSSEEGSKGESESGSKGSGGSGAGEQGGSPTLPPIKHVFLIVLGEQGYQATYGSGSGAPYLAKTLRDQGELASGYFGVTSGQLANEIALISGQGPTPQTAANCPTYESLSPGGSGSEGQILGSGCLYPGSALTIGDQLIAAEDTWKAYIGGLDEGATADLQGKCPAPALGASDPHATATAASPFVTWRDPFLYFRSVTGSSSSCAQQNVGIGQLASDLRSVGSTPSLAYIAPSPCEDGDTQQCAGASSSGLTAAEGFLKRVVPEIESSAGYKEGGLIAIAADQAPQSGAGADSSGCCGTPTFPNLPASGASTVTGQPKGGGKVGLLLISKYVKPGSSYVTGEYNHFSLLASIEALFKLPTLGFGKNVQLPTFERALYNAYS